MLYPNKTYLLKLMRKFLIKYTTNEVLRILFDRHARYLYLNQCNLITNSSVINNRNKQIDLTLFNYLINATKLTIEYRHITVA